MRVAIAMVVAGLLCIGQNSFAAMDLEYVRSNYIKAASDKNLCRLMIEELDKDTETNVHLAYLGALQTIWAKHTFNPISKLSTFIRGKHNIEESIKNDPANVEIRFIRLSVQKNAPGFLGYSSNIAEDELYVRNRLHVIAPTSLQKLAAKLISDQ